jgi:hypothetical protein
MATIRELHGVSPGPVGAPSHEPNQPRHDSQVQDPLNPDPDTPSTASPSGGYPLRRVYCRTSHTRETWDESDMPTTATATNGALRRRFNLRSENAKSKGNSGSSSPTTTTSSNGAPLCRVNCCSSQVRKERHSNTEAPSTVSSSDCASSDGAPLCRVNCRSDPALEGRNTEKNTPTTGTGSNDGPPCGMGQCSCSHRDTGASSPACASTAMCTSPVNRQADFVSPSTEYLTPSEFSSSLEPLTPLSPCVLRHSRTARL